MAFSSASTCSTVRLPGIGRLPFRRMAAGTVWSISSSSEATPRVANMCERSASSGPMWRPTKSSLPSSEASGAPAVDEVG